MSKLLSKPLLWSFALLVAGIIAGLNFRGMQPPVAIKRSLAVVQPATTAAVPVAAAERPALTAAEETYINQLWKIHDKVKHSAFQLTFAGMSYKMGSLDRAGIKEKVPAQTEIYRAALADMAKLTVPPSLQGQHKMYADAVNLYEQASLELVKVAGDGNEQHLFDAHSKTELAAAKLLEVGGQLWPGEFKPH